MKETFLQFRQCLGHSLLKKCYELLHYKNSRLFKLEKLVKNNPKVIKVQLDL